MLFLTAGISTVFAAETQDSTAPEKTTKKTTKKAAKPKTAKPKKEVKAVPLEEAIKIATTPTLAQKRARRLEQKKKYAAKGLDMHVVEKGETLRGICQKYGVRMGSVRKLNGLTTTSVIKENDILKLRK